MPTQLACAYLKGYLTGRALNWFEVLGYRIVEEKAKDYARLKHVLTEQFPVVRNRSELETRFYASYRNHNQRLSDSVQENWKDTRINNRYSDKADRRGNPTDLKVKGVGDNLRFDSRRGQSDHRFHNQGGRQGGSRISTFRIQNGQKKISSLRMTPVDLPYVPILLNETFIAALWDTGAEKSFIFKEVYRRYFSYRLRQKTKDRYQCILGIDIMKESKLTLDFDQKSLIIPGDNVDGSQISCAALRALALNSREQLIREQRKDPELEHIYRYLENPVNGSVHATVCEDWSQDFKLIDGLLFYWSELIPLRKALTQATPKALFENYISRYGAPISLISDNGPQFISDVFEHLSHRLDIKHMKTVTYRPQANLTERVNRTLVQMIGCFVEENHGNWDRFLHQFFFTLRTAVNETTGKTPAELFLGRKIITLFRKLINVADGADYVGGNIEKLFDEESKICGNNIREGKDIIIEKGERVLDESRSFFRVHTGYFSNIPKCIKAEFIASWACSQSSVVSSSKR
ncbi:uncharacterized protein TNCV_112531 [Trichonephila clavipes]|nr:uncharacterized protein TNCV_112531 [Trichonephila clavipes]